MLLRRSIATFVVAFLTGCGDRDVPAPPEPPPIDASTAEIEAALDDYLAWLDECGSLEDCAAAVEDSGWGDYADQVDAATDSTECRPGLDIGC